MLQWSDFVPVAALKLPVSFIFAACAARLSNRVVCCAFHLVGLCMLPLALVLRQAIK